MTVARMPSWGRWFAAAGAMAALHVSIRAADAAATPAAVVTAEFINEHAP